MRLSVGVQWSRVLGMQHKCTCLDLLVLIRIGHRINSTTTSNEKTKLFNKYLSEHS